MPQNAPSLARYFAELPDPRVDRTKKHTLGDILVIALSPPSPGPTRGRRSSGSGGPSTTG